MINYFKEALEYKGELIEKEEPYTKFLKLD